MDGGARNGRIFGGPRGVVATAQAWREQGRDFSLAIVVDTEGSTYRKPGAFAVVCANGERHGVLSGGCLEPGIDALALRALETRIPQCAEFDTRGDDDLLFGSGSGCRGRMRVIACPVLADRNEPLYRALVDASHSGEMLRVAMVVEGPHTGSAVAWNSSRSIAPAHLDEGMESLALLHGCENGRRRCVVDGFEVDTSIFDVHPPVRLLLFGAGPEAAPLLDFARAMGWFTVLVDHRKTLLDAHSGAADRLLPGRPAAAAPQLESMRFDAAIAMTHLASADLDALKFMAVRSMRYIGLLGPASRRDGLLDQLRDDARTSLEGRLHAPVGLPLGGEGPEAIALSIVAEIQRRLAQPA